MDIMVVMLLLFFGYLEIASCSVWFRPGRVEESDEFCDCLWESYFLLCTFALCGEQAKIQLTVKCLHLR